MYDNLLKQSHCAHNIHSHLKSKNHAEFSTYHLGLKSFTVKIPCSQKTNVISFSELIIV